MVADDVGIPSCSSKSCCQRWKSKHQPNLILGPFSDLEDAVVIAALQASPGLLWPHSPVLSRLPLRILDAVLSACTAFHGLSLHSALHTNATAKPKITLPDIVWGHLQGNPSPSTAF